MFKLNNIDLETWPVEPLCGESPNSNNTGFSKKKKRAFLIGFDPITHACKSLEMQGTMGNFSNIPGGCM